MRFVSEKNRQQIEDFIRFAHSGNKTTRELKDPLGSGNDVVLETKDRYGIPVRTVLNINTGLIRTDPYYEKSALELFYSKYYRKMYVTSHPDSESPRSSLLSLQIKTGCSIYKNVKEYISNPSKILDFGGGMGGALIPFSEAGHETLCMDYGEDYLEFSNSIGISTRLGGLEEIPPSELYDLIILSHVLEHVVDPIPFLKRISVHLKPKGFLYIDVPSLNWVHKIWNNNLIYHLQNAHVWYFTRRTLNNLLLLADFKSVRWISGTTCLCSPEIDKFEQKLCELKPRTDIQLYLKLNKAIKPFPKNIRVLMGKLLDRLYCDM